MDGMKVIQEIRLGNLRTLLAESGGAVVELAKRLERSQGQISQLLNESVDKKTGKKKQIGDSQARYIESKFKKERGWMDNDHSSLAAMIAAAVASHAEKQGMKATDDYVEKNMTSFVRPDSPLALRLKRESIVKDVQEAGDQRDLFRDTAKKTPRDAEQ